MKQSRYSVGDEIEYKEYGIGGEDRTRNQGVITEILVEYHIQPKGTTNPNARQWREEDNVSLYEPTLLEACQAYRDYVTNGEIGNLQALRRDLLDALAKEEEE